MLQNYPNKQFVLEGFSNDFILGFEGEEVATYGSIIDNMDIAQQKIDQEVQLNRIAGPFVNPPLEDFKVSPLALRPKRNSNKFRLLHNLSYP